MRRMIAVFLSICLISVAAVAADSGGLSAPDLQALRDTQELLNDSSARQKVIQGNAKAEAADKKVDGVAKGNDGKIDQKTKDQVYQLSGDALSDLAKQQGGDADAMLKTIEKAQADPEGFYNSLSPETREKVKALSREISSQQSPVK